MRGRAWTAVLWLVFTASALPGCRRPARAGAPVVARWSDGAITQGDVEREAGKMPAELRRQFDSPYGRRELASALVDKRLLVEEARRRGLADRPEIRRQLEELEERLVIQALVAEEAKQAGATPEAELRAWYRAHGQELARPARARVGRVLIRLEPGATAAERERARSRVQALARRLEAGEPFDRIAALGEGAERLRQGDLGFVVEHGGGDPALESAALALRHPGDVSAPVTCREGIALLRLVERREGSVPSFEEARGEIANRMAPAQQRRIFELLVERLRREFKVAVTAAAEG